MNNWYLVYCKPGQDKLAETCLNRRGFHVFRPTIDLIKSRAGSRPTVKSESLFPRYLFLKADPNEQSIAPVSSTHGVSNFVKFGDQYATASDVLVEEIKWYTEQRKERSNEANFELGEKIKVNGQGFEDMDAIYYKPCGKDRALVLLTLMGQQSKMLVSSKTIYKI